MREVNYKVFTIDELSEEAKENAIENYRERNSEYLYDESDADIFIDSCLWQLKEDGVSEDKDIYFSLSYQQGDGLGIYGNVSNEDIQAILKLEGENNLTKLAEFIEMSCVIKHIGRYYHTGSMQFNFDDTLYYQDDEDIKEFLIKQLEYPEDEVNSENFYRMIERECEEIVRYIECYFIDKAEEFEDAGYKDIEFHQSDECIYETCYANEIEFLEDGTLNRMY